MFLGNTTLVDREWMTWFPLPDDLARRVTDAGLPDRVDEFEGGGPEHLDEVLANALRATRNRLDYHTQQHHEEVLENGGNALDALARMRRITWPTGLVEASLLGYATHVLGHPGSKFWQEAPRFDRVPSHIRGNEAMTVEEYSARRADDIARRARCTLHQRLLVQYTILSSVRGLDRIRVSGLLGLVMQVSDAVPADEFTVNLNRSVGALYGEVWTGPPPPDLEALLQNRRAYLDDFGGQMDKLDAAAGLGLTEHLGWRRRLVRARAELDQFADSPRKRGTLAAELDQRGYKLYRDGRIRFEGIPELDAMARTVTVVYTGVVESTLGFGRTTLQFRATVVRRLRSLEASVKKHGGVPLNRTGDGLLAMFDSVGAALRYAIELTALAPPPVSIGLSHGEVVSSDDGCYGRPVVEAIRLCDFADAGEVLASSRLATVVEPGFVFGTPQEVELRGIGTMYMSTVSLRP